MEVTFCRGIKVRRYNTDIPFAKMLNKLISCTLLFFALTQGVLSAGPIPQPCDGPYAHPVSSAASGTGACWIFEKLGCCVVHKEIFAMLGFECMRRKRINGGFYAEGEKLDLWRWCSMICQGAALFLGGGVMWCCAKKMPVSSLVGRRGDIRNHDERQAGILVGVWAFGHVGDSTPATSTVETRCEISALEAKLDTDTPALQIQRPCACTVDDENEPAITRIKGQHRHNAVSGSAHRGASGVVRGEDRSAVAPGISEGRVQNKNDFFRPQRWFETWDTDERVDLQTSQSCSHSLLDLTAILQNPHAEATRICGVNAPATQGTRRLESAEADGDCGIDEAAVALSKFEIEKNRKERGVAV
ncbi:hypothetical protein FB451DRAFT_1365720 [Mycena latifolia]|nr:hypothetical protein FB451DRAFT_1365720 [Mycena latifolia]